MKLPYLTDTGSRTKKSVIRFLGVNYSENITDGQLEDCRNLSTRMFPCLSQRVGRERGSTYDNATAIWYKDGHAMVVDGTDLIYNGAVVGTVTPGKKQFANVNTKIVVFPDKIMYDTKTGELRSLSAEHVVEGGVLEFTDSKTLKIHLGSYRAELVSSGTYGLDADGNPGLKVEEGREVLDCRIAGVLVNSEDGSITVGEKTRVWNPSDWKVGDLFLQDSIGIDGVTSWGKITNILDYTYRDYYEPLGVDFIAFEYDRYEARGTSYGKFSGFEAMNFREGDTIEISGCTTYPDNNTEAITVREITAEEINGHTRYGLVFDAASFTGVGVEAGEVTIRRKVPNLSIICESNNRLFGAEGNTIHVSALGDPTNFNTFDGVDTDSYSVAVATEGAFTACIGYENMVFFFKEDCLHKLMGLYPSEYQLFDYTVPGVLSGSQNSLVNINENVFYHGREGVYRYNGGTPELISECFGLRRFDTAAAGSAGECYYISMRDKRTGQWGLWVYDMAYDIWLQEDETQAVCFARNGGELHYIDGSDGCLVYANPDSSEEAFEWSATFCRMDEVYLNRKRYLRLFLRVDLSEEASLRAEISCDGGAFQPITLIQTGSPRTAVLPIMPNRCDNFRIRLTGTGKVILRSLVREYDVGSEY